MKAYMKVHKTWKESDGYPLTTLYDSVGKRIIRVFLTGCTCYDNEFKPKRQHNDDGEKINEKVWLDDIVKYHTEGAEIIELDPEVFNEIFRIENQARAYTSVISELESKIREINSKELELIERLNPEKFKEGQIFKRNNN